MSALREQMTAFADEVLAPGFGPVTLTMEQRESLMEMIYRGTGALEPGCADCGLSYTDSGWVDCVISRENWAAISPTGDEGGLLCLTCMTRRIVAAGLDDVQLLVTSGPYVYGPNTAHTSPHGEDERYLRSLVDHWQGQANYWRGIVDQLTEEAETPTQGEE